MKVKQLEAMLQILLSQQVGGGHQLTGTQTEFSIFTGTLGPLSSSLAEQASTDTDHWFHPYLTGNFDDLAQLLHLFDHQNHSLVELDSHEGHVDESVVLVAIAYEQAVLVILEGHGGKKLWFAADFQSHAIGFTGIENFFYHLTKLVDLEWKNTSIPVLVIRFLDRQLKGSVDGLYAMPQDILKPDKDGKFQAP